ncbi:MAG: enoyl-CoA hydratase-related protein, partial [Myxococcota bacterium]
MDLGSLGRRLEARGGRLPFEIGAYVALEVCERLLEGPAAIEAEDVRVASDHKSTKIGLPEVQLGIVPGFGGTQRLSRLVGLPTALAAILPGKMFDPVRAFKKGLVDRVAPSARLIDAAKQEIHKLHKQGK